MTTSSADLAGALHRAHHGYYMGVDRAFFLLPADAKALAEEVNRLCAVLESIVRGGYAPGADKAHPAVGLAREALSKPNDKLTYGIPTTTHERK